MPQEILDINQAEQKWIEDNIQSAKSIIQKFAPSYTGEISLEGLDAAFSAWLSQHNPQAENPNPFINAFGMAYGQYLRDKLELKWAIVKDEYGTEIAVYGDVGNILVFPPNFVAKRYEAKITNFFAPMGTQMINDVQAIRSKIKPYQAENSTSRWKFWNKKR